jgi:hypothetical protein
MNFFIRIALVFLFIVATNTRVHADVNPLSFNSAFGLNGQRWQYNRDTHIANGKTAYILSMDGVYIEKGDGKWTEKLFSRKVLSTYGLPKAIAVTKSGKLGVAFKKRVPEPQVYHNTVLLFDRDMRINRTVDLGSRQVLDLDVINDEVVTIFALKSLDDRVYQIADVKTNGLTWRTLPEVPGMYVRKYKVIGNTRHLMYIGEDNSTVFRLRDGEILPVPNASVGPDANYGQLSDFTLSKGIFYGVNGHSMTIKDGQGIQIKRFDSDTEPQFSNISYSGVQSYADGTVLIHGNFAFELLTSSGKTIQQVGGYGNTIPIGAVGYCGVNVSESQVWLPVPQGIQVLGDDERLLTISDSQGDLGLVTAIDLYDNKHVAVAYTSKVRSESGILLLDKNTGKQKRRMMVRNESHWYTHLVVLDDEEKPQIFALSGDGVVSDNSRFGAMLGFTDLKRMGNSIMLRSETGFTKINAKGVTVANNLYPFLAGSIYQYAFLSNGWFVSSNELYDEEGQFLYSFLGSIHGCLSVSDNTLVLHVNETTSVVFKY